MQRAWRSALIGSALFLAGGVTASAINSSTDTPFAGTLATCPNDGQHDTCGPTPFPLPALAVAEPDNTTLLDKNATTCMYPDDVQSVAIPKGGPINIDLRTVVGEQPATSKRPADAPVGPYVYVVSEYCDGSTTPPHLTQQVIRIPYTGMPPSITIKTTRFKHPT